MSGVSLNGTCDTMDNSGRALKLQTDAPHLVSMGGDRLSTSVTLHPLPQGRVVLGSGPCVDILVQGTGVSPIHCHIENSEGVVTIYPLADNLSIDGIQISTPTRLSQGAMLTIGRSNYMRFNHPAEAKLMKSVLPNPRISMPSISFEQESQIQTVKFLKKPPAVPKKSPRESYSDSGSEEAPSSIMTKVSKFEYLAAQNLKKSISPKVFTSSAVTVNTPAKDVLGKSPPDLHNLAKNLPQSALNYSELNHNNEKQKVKVRDWPLFGKKSPQYVNVELNDTKNINNRVIIYENGIKQQNINIDEGSENFNKTSSGSKNINTQKVIIPSPGYDRNPGPYNRSVTPSPIHKNLKAIHRRSNSLDQLINGSIYDNTEELHERKKEAEIKRNQAQQDRIKEQELEKAEQARLEEILNMCAEYEKQSQSDKNKPVTPNRIKTNGSLPRDKRHQISQGPFGSPYSTPPSSPGIFDFQKSSQHAYENTPLNFPMPRKTITSNYENIDFTPPEISSGERKNDFNNYENIKYQSTPTSHYPNSPRTRIKTFVTAGKDSSQKDTTNIIENKFTILEKEQYLLENLNRTKDTIEDNSIDNNTRKPTPTKFILPLDDVDLVQDTTDTKVNNNCNSTNSLNNSNRTNKSNRSRYQSLKTQKKKLLDAVGNLKTLISEIEIQEEELHIEMDMERALLSGEHKAKILDLENLKSKKEKLFKQAQKIESIMQEAQNKQTENERTCQDRLKTAQEKTAEVEKKLASTDKTTEEYEIVFENYLKCQEILDAERKSFEDLEFHHLEEEANWLATREEIQREILDLSHRIENLQKQINDLGQQSLDAASANNKEYKSLESQKINCLVRLEEVRNRLKDVDAKLAEFSDQESEHEMTSDTDSDKSRDLFQHDFNMMKDLSCSIIVSNSTIPSEHGFLMSHSFNDKLMQDKMILEPGIEKKFPSQDDIDRISKVTSDSPMDIASLNRKTIESLKEIERNRHLHLCQQGSQVIEQERQRVQALKERAQQEVKSKWAQRIQDCASMTSTGSEGTASGEKTDDSNTDRNEGKESPSSPDQSDASRTENDETALQQRPLSELSEMSLEGGTFRKRGKPATDKQRPLTRYLPIKSSDLDLRQHIESAGHQVVLCPHVLINTTSCRGFLHKKGSKLNGWSRRWFVFDRSKHTFSYYADKNEKKARGGAYFQAIEEVYVDHSKSVKSPNPQLTFVVKTHERYYYLMAPSPEAMRIWVDVIFTGAEGYQEFEYGT